MDEELIYFSITQHIRINIGEYCKTTGYNLVMLSNFT